MKLSDTSRLTASLQVHLAHCDLIAVLMQLGGRQQLYLSLIGCPGCTLGRCEPGCPRDLLSRALSRSLPGSRMHQIPGGLATRPYKQFALATPGATAQPLHGDLLTNWPEARLTVYWRSGKEPAVGVLLATHEEGPAPATVLVEAGWQPVRQLPFLRAKMPPIATTLAVTGAWHGPLWLPLPLSQDGLSGDDADGSLLRPEASLQATLALAERLSARLAPLLEVDPEADQQFFRLWATPWAMSDPAAAEANEEVEEPAVAYETQVAIAEPLESSIWPAGPGRMRPADVGFFIEQIRTSPIVQTGSEPGVTRRRVAQLLPEDLSEYSRQLVYWLHVAGLLTPPAVPEEPFRNPRPLIELPDEGLAAQLAATPVPTPEQARAAMQR